MDAVDDNKGRAATLLIPRIVLMEHSAAFLSRLLDVIDGDIAPKTSAAVQAGSRDW